eukprot:4183043-Prymnesium_polylepis.1
MIELLDAGSRLYGAPLGGFRAHYYAAGILRHIRRTHTVIRLADGERKVRAHERTGWPGSLASTTVLRRYAFGRLLVACYACKIA